MDAAIKLVESKNHGNLAFAVIKNGEVFGEYFSGIEDEITRDTIFPTASMSKWITATSVMHLVQRGQLDLDTPISEYLSRWHLPDSKYDNNKVTARLLLSHMSGLPDVLHTERTIRRALPTIGVGSALVLITMVVIILRRV